MAAQIGDLAVRVGANTADLEQGMARASRSVKAFGKQARSAANAAAKMGAAAVAAGAAMTAAIYAKQSKTIDQLAKTADALNLTTESLQALNHMAELNGVSSESMAKGLRRMEVNLGMAARQGGASAKALEDVGVSIEDIIKLSPDKQIQALSDAIAGVENQSIKASIATDLFGRDGVAMLKVLNQIEKDGLDPTVQKLKDYGIAISRVDAAQVEAANDAFLEAQKVVEGLGNTLTVELAPFVKELADRFVNLAEESGGFGHHIESAVRRSLHFVGKLANVIRGLKVVFKGVELIAVGFGAAVASVFELALTGIMKFADAAIGVTNTVIGGLNKIPKVDLSLIESASDSEFMEGIHAAGNHARDSVSRVRSELHELAMQKMPSEAVEEYLEAVKAKSLEVAEEVALARDKILNPEEKELTDEEKYLAKEELYRQHMQNMFGITHDGYSGIANLTNKHWGAAAAETTGAMKSVVNTMATGSKKAFEISKAWALADAIISTFQGIAAGVRLGWPMAIPAVAYAAATGFAQVSQIRAQQFGGAGGAAASGAGAPGTAPNPVDVGGNTGTGGGGGELTVSPIDPNAIFSGASMQAFGERIYDYSKDGGKVVFAA